MKKPFGIVIFGFIIFVFAFSDYHSKKEYYEVDKAFYDNANVSGEVVKIMQGRGTRIFYTDTDFFYAECVAGNAIAGTIKIGDVVRKRDSVLEILREANKKEMRRVAIAIVENPGDSYFRYFFGW